MMNKVYFSFLLSLLGLPSPNAQKVLPSTGNNKLTQVEFNAVEISGVTFQELAETNGNLSKMQGLFGTDLTYEYVNNDPVIYKNFGNAHLSIVFNSDDGDYFYPSYIQITSYSANLKIKGKSIKLGDNKSVLGSNISIINGSKAIFLDQATESMSFRVIIENDIITKIEFNSY